MLAATAMWTVSSIRTLRAVIAAVTSSAGISVLPAYLCAAALARGRGSPLEPEIPPSTPSTWPYAPAPSPNPGWRGSTSTWFATPGVDVRGQWESGSR